MVSGVDSVAKIEEVRRQLIEGAMPAELAAGPEGLFIPGQTMDRIWLKSTVPGPAVMLPSLLAPQAGTLAVVGIMGPQLPELEQW
jgi:hypothetical protein